MATNEYPARLDIDYPPTLNRVTTFFRLIFVIPIFFLFSIIAGSFDGSYVDQQTGEMMGGSGGIIVALFVATVLMILFRQRYPRWWFDFNLELNRFATRLSAYMLLLTDKYPSTVEAQTVHLELDYPDVKQQLNRGLPLVKWLLAFPHYVVLILLAIPVIGAVVIAWFAVLFTGRYPRSLFDIVVGYTRWNLRVSAYAILLVTDKYPPFSLR